MVLMDYLGAEAPVLDEARKVLANGHTKILIIQLSGAETDRFLILENPNELTLLNASERLAGFSKFELRSDNVLFGGVETLALHIIAS
jgi:hypothetical protein